MGVDPTPLDVTRSRARVALIASSYAPHVGGVETHVARVASELRARGTAVEVWSVDRGAPPSENEPIPVRYLATPLPARSLRSAARFGVRAPAAWTAWGRAVREFRPNILHVHCFGPNGVYAQALHRRFGTALVVTSHGETLADDTGAFSRSALLRAELRRALSNADIVTAPSEFVLADLRANYGLGEGRIVPNGVDFDVAPTGSMPIDRPYFFAVGRLGHMKGFDLLIDAFAAARLDPAIDLVIAGDGAERTELEARIVRRGLQGRVRLHGWMDTAEVAAAMSSALAVVVPSRAEAFGIVALEAWRSGAPLIMTDRGGAREFIRDGVDGMLVDPTDTGALAGMLERVIADADARSALVAAGRDRVADFSWARVADAYGDIYAEILG
jgi:glycogen(starch) synthase